MRGRRSRNGSVIGTGTGVAVTGTLAGTGSSAEAVGVGMRSNATVSTPEEAIGTEMAGIGTSTQAEEIETNNTVNTRAMTPGHMSLPMEREVRMRLTGPGIPAIIYRGGRIEKEALTTTGTAAAVTSE